ncbi:MAG: stage II sporulation protein M [Methanomicrobiales archaeon]
MKKEKFESSIGALYRRNEKFLFLSAGILFASIFIGYFLSGIFSSFDQYFGTIFQELKEGVQKGEIKLETLPILINNIRVALIIYGGGLLLGSFTAIFLFINGAFIGYVISKVPIGDFIIFTLPHGVIEILAIIIAGAAGFRLAASVYYFIDGMLYKTWYGSIFEKIAFVFRENLDEFKESLLLLGISIVLLIIAAIIEANITLAWADYVRSII